MGRVGRTVIPCFKSDRSSMGPEYFSDFSSQKQVNRNKTLELLKGTKPFLRFFSSFLFFFLQTKFLQDFLIGLIIHANMPPFLEFPLQRPPLRSTTSTGIWPRGCTEALGKHSADCRRCAMWPVLSSPAANKGYHECYVYSPSCQGGCFPSLKSFLW